MRLPIALVVHTIFLIHMAYPQHSGSIDIASKNVVQFIVTDPLGRRTGADPRGAPNPLSGVHIAEIPGASYATVTPGDSPNDSSGITNDEDLMFEFDYQIKAPEDDGVYQFEAIGTKQGIYTMYIRVVAHSRSVLQSIDTVVDGIIDSLQSNFYELDYHGIPGTPIHFRKIVSGSTLRQDVDVGYAKGWLGNRSLCDDLNNRLVSFKTCIANFDSSNARRVLVGLQAEIDQAGHHPSGAKFIAADEYQVLSSDVRVLLDHFPPTPRRP